MMIDLTQIVVALIGLLSTVITVVLVPWIKSKLTNEQEKLLNTIVKTGVFAAEQLFTKEQVDEKKTYVQSLLQENGFAIDIPSVDAAIEAAVASLKMTKSILPEKMDEIPNQLDEPEEAEG